MAARQGDAGLGADGPGAFEYLACCFGWQFVYWPAQDGDREDRLAAHGIDITDRIGRGDAAEIEGVVNDRHEEIRCGDECRAIAEVEDGGVISFIVSYEEPGIWFCDCRAA